MNALPGSSHVLVVYIHHSLIEFPKQNSKPGTPPISLDSNTFKITIHRVLSSRVLYLTLDYFFYYLLYQKNKIKK